MAHHKKRRARKQRATCFLCSPHKMNGQLNGDGAQRRQELRARISHREQLREMPTARS